MKISTCTLLSLFGLIKALALKYFRQNTYFSDFKSLMTKLGQRLIDRGYPSQKVIDEVKDLIFDAHNGKLHSKSKAREERPIFLKLFYDMNGPSQSEIRQLLDIDTLEAELSKHNLGRIVICFKKKANLRSLLGKAASRSQKQRPHLNEVTRGL